MTTTTATTIKPNVKPDVRKFVKRMTQIVTKDTTDVIGETLVTLVVYGVTLSAMNIVGHPYLLTFFPGLYSLMMIVFWFIRFVRHFDDSATNNELRDQIDERFAELQNEIGELKDTVIRNMVP